MILQNEICHIEINIDEAYTVDSVDNRHYDVTLNPEHYRHNDLSKTLSIHIGLYAREFQVALIGPYHHMIWIVPFCKMTFLQFYKTI